jgi:two-component system, response regulator / RNA-binding antiterminator
MDHSLKIVIVDKNPVRAAILEEGVREAGHVHVVRIDETSHLLARIYAFEPDVILIDLENPSRDLLEQMFQVSRAARRPVAMFVEQSDAASIEAAVDAGVSAYVVGGLRKERIKTILDLCISRFNAFARAHAHRARRAQGDRPGQGHSHESQESHRARRLCAAAPNRDEREQEDRRRGAIGDYRRGPAGMNFLRCTKFLHGCLDNGRWAAVESRGCGPGLRAI